MVISCTAFSASATEPVEVLASYESAVARNRDLLNMDGVVLDGTSTVYDIYPSKGDNVKVYVYLISGSLKVQYKTPGAWTCKTAATFTKDGHNWAEIVMNCSETHYQIRLGGVAAMFNLGVYTEP